MTAHGSARLKSGAQKTRPSAQYAANDLASPDIEIGSRHPVNCILPRNRTGGCEPVHNGSEKIAAGPMMSTRQEQSFVENRYAERLNPV